MTDDAIRIYLDGVEGVPYYPYTEPIKFTGIPLSVGVSSGAPGYLTWNGLIDEISIYNRALSAEEVKELYNSETSQ